MNDYVFFNKPPTFLILVSLQTMNYLRSKSQRYRDKNITVQFRSVYSNIKY